MSKENDDKANDNIKITFGAFSTNTNIEEKSLKSLIKAFNESSESSEIIIINKIQYEFTHKILSENGNKFSCKNIFLELNNTSKNNKINDLIDCYIIFFDLENSDSLIELDKILNYLNAIDISYRKIYLINFFFDKNNVQSNLTEDNINLYFDKYQIENYDISDIDLTESNNELVKIIDSITIEMLEDKGLVIDGVIIKGNNNFLNDEKDRSKCLIF